MSKAALPFVMITAFLFGSTLIASRFSVGQFAPLGYISSRLVIASAIFFLWYLVRHRNLPTDRRLWRHAGIFGIFGSAVNLVGIVGSLEYQSSGLTAVLVTTSPAMTALLAHVFLPDERLIRAQWLGVIFALGGAVLLAAGGESGLPQVSADPRGYLLVAMGIISGSAASIYARIHLREFDNFEAASIRMWVAGMALVPITILTGGFDFSVVDGNGYFALLYASLVGTFGGFFMQLYTIDRFGVIPASMVTYLIPLVTGIGGVLILGETFTPLMVFGVVIIISGVALVQQKPALNAT